MTTVLIHYGEIALKGKNRRYFENRLLDNIRAGLQGLSVEAVRRIYGRLLVAFEGDDAWEPARERLERIFGIAHFERAREAAADIDRMAETLLEAIEGREAESFAIVPHRGDKTFPMISTEIGRVLGAHVQGATGWKVDLDTPALPIHVFVLPKRAFISFERFPGIGGLPLGTGGRVVSLLSGGIDSPVATWRLMRRGCVPVFVHFHSHPFTDAASQEKAVEIARILCRYQRPARLYLVPFAPVQRRIVTDAPPPLRVILYRRYMIRIAEAIARQEKASALVTGESLGQVASQTLSNMSAIDAAATLPILRPLVGSDKVEIVREARRIGTYELSIEPHQDCCSFLMPRNPATRSRCEDLEPYEASMGVESLVEEARAAAEVKIVPAQD